MELQLPSDADPDPNAFEQFLVSVGACQYPLCLEIIGTATSVTIQMVADSSDASLIENQLPAYIPQAIIQHRDGTLLRAFSQADPLESLIVEFGLSREAMLPLATHTDLRIDPYAGLIAALGGLNEGDLAVFQVRFEPVHHPWTASFRRALCYPDGTPFFEDAKEFYAFAKAKLSRPLFAAVVRVGCASQDEDRVWEIARSVAGALRQFANPMANELIPLSNTDYDQDDHLEDFINRRSRRGGMLLNCQELASLVHLPGESVRNAKLNRLVKKTKRAPQETAGHPLVLGTNVHNGQTEEVSVSADQRVRHMHVIGASGTGKSTFLLNLIMQDIEQGQGVGVIDPHGDLIDQILSRIPESRIKDVVLVDPSDDLWPIGFNILNAHSDLEKTLLASDLVAIFRRYSTTWGDQMGSVLSNAVLAFLESSRGGTLSDLRRFLIEPTFRNEFLTTVQDSHVVYFWKKEFSLLSGRPQAPLLTRLDTFLRPKPIRHMVSQKANRLDMADIMDHGKIFLAKLAQGAIGEENASVLGSLIVSKFHQLTLGRQAISEQSRRYFWLYCDEFGGYVTPSMAKLLSGARKYRLGLILAHQGLQQLRYEADVQSAVIANAATRVCFRLGDTDAKTLADGFAAFEAEDFGTLGTGEAICRVGRSDADFNLSVPMADEVDSATAERRRSAIIDFTRRTYAIPRAQVEALLAVDRNDVEEVPAKEKKKAGPPAKIEKEVEPVKTGEQRAPKVDPSPPVPVQVKPEPATAENVPKSKVPEPPPKQKKQKTRPGQTAPLGKGGPTHKYLQQMLTQWAQGYGWHTTIEKPIPNGTGSVDVVLEREDRKIACEISVTSTVEQELGNLQKCLAAGFVDVLMICAQPKTLTGLKKTAPTKMGTEALKGVRFLSSEEIFVSEELVELLSVCKEETVNGYKLKVRLGALSETEAKERRRVISEVMMRGMKT